MGIRAIIPKQKTQDTIVFNYSLFTNEDKLVLAPMQNLTGLFFRKTFSQFFPSNIDYAVSPFISVSSGQGNAPELQRKNIPLRFYDILPEENTGLMPLVPQILGNNPEGILECAAIIERLGYREVNLNMGCPKKDIVNRHRGAGLLKDTDTVQRIIETVLENTNLQLSLKVRLGINDASELQNLVPILNKYPLKSVCIHPRTQSQQYEGHPDTQAFEYFSSQLKHTVIYNGYIFSVGDFTALKMRFPYIKHWMIGRGLLQNPFLCADIRGINYNKHATLLPYLTALQNSFSQSLFRCNEITVLNKMKEFVKYLGTGYGFDATPLLHMSSLADFDRLLADTISSQTSDIQ